ncbi:contact-dependent growth inhibition system immunity protein [Streptomyces sp. NPDC005283]|uniref:contact-dependent growth inhibition system immunity protein n=1 Tax=Streptomyces sp. NPDC005283 TaxID=3156871 RepID=UPI003451A2A3
MADQIRYLAQAYFHPDYDLEAEEPISILTAFRKNEPAEVVVELRAAMEEVISSGVGEDGLAEIWLDEAGASYDPRENGIEMSLWFRRMIDSLA